MYFNQYLNIDINTATYITSHITDTIDGKFCLASNKLCMSCRLMYTFKPSGIFTVFTTAP